MRAEESPIQRRLPLPRLPHAVNIDDDRVFAVQVAGGALMPIHFERQKWEKLWTKSFLAENKNVQSYIRKNTPKDDAASKARESLHVHYNIPEHVRTYD